MGTVLHAFTSYNIKENYGEYEIEYKNDEDYDIAYGNWHYIYTILQYGDYLLGTKDTYIPVYDYMDDGYKVKEEGMKLVNPEIIVKICVAVIENITKLTDSENPLIDERDWYLYESDMPISEQKEKLIDYANLLLKWANKGLYFVEERE